MKEKLKVSVQLDWGCERFKLLGITFDVDLNTMNCLNLSKVTHDVKCEMKKWQTRKLSPF